MKKILSFLAAGALAFALIGCSGDLHDSGFDVHIVGSNVDSDWDTGKSMSTYGDVDTANGQIFTWTVTASSSDAMEFKLKSSDYSAWTDDWGYSTTDGTLDLTLDAYLTPLTGRAALSSGPGNITFTPTAGSTYTITVVYNPFGSTTTMYIAICSGDTVGEFEPEEEPEQIDLSYVKYIIGTPTGNEWAEMTEVDGGYEYTFTWEYVDSENTGLNWGEGYDTGDDGTVTAALQFKVHDVGTWDEGTTKYGGTLTFVKGADQHITSGNFTTDKAGDNSATPSISPNVKYTIRFYTVNNNTELVGTIRKAN